MSSSSLTELAAELVRIDSVNPDLVPGGAGEGELARFVAGWLEDVGLEVEVEEAAPGRPNVVGRARGSGGGATLLLNAHMDTVGYDGMEAPLDPRIEEGRLYGRGAYDMKGSLAAIMVAGAEAAHAGLLGDVLVAAVVDEEVFSIGAEAVARRYRADAAIVAEPTELRLVIAHKGFVWMEIETKGRAAHGSRPDLGEDAIVRMGRVLTGLGALSESLLDNPSHRLLGSGSVHASLIGGGVELSTYPESCVLSLERRTVPGETVDIVERQIAEIADGAEIRTTFVREPFEVGEDEPVVQALLRHAGGPEVTGVPFWADSAVFAAAGIPTVVFGPGGEGAHAQVEWVDLADLERCKDLYVAVARELCA
ncbi:MAG TPA: M20/M25/M40 family metallo-hydrolase [Gaiellaceae bacterium]|nr:M20/M25/M40 family metallo-hydrolase [Gaiellaceae bacterium]